MRLTKQQFIDRFEPEEMAGILAITKTNVAVEAWLFRFNNLTPDSDGTSVDTKDPRTIAGLQSLENAGLLSTGRTQEILSEQVSVPGGIEEHGGIASGSSVRVLAPFDVSYPEPLVVESITATDDGNTVFVLTGAGGFGREYLEPLQ